MAIYEFEKGNALPGVRDKFLVDGFARSLHAGPLDNICDEKSSIQGRVV